MSNMQQYMAFKKPSYIKWLLLYNTKWVNLFKSVTAVEAKYRCYSYLQKYKPDIIKNKLIDKTLVWPSYQFI